METQLENTAYTIDADIPCSQCGYNLRSLDAGGRCPECGQAVGETLVRLHYARNDVVPLRMEDPSRVGRLFDAICILLVPMVILCVFYLGPDEYWRLSSPGWFFAFAATGTAWLLTWVGMMLLSFLLPRDTGERRTGEFRWAWRVGATLAAAHVLALRLVWSLAQMEWIAIGVSWIWLFTPFLFYQSLSQLAIRLPSRALAIQFRILSIIIPASVLFGGRFEFANGLGREPSLIYGHLSWLHEIGPATGGINLPILEAQNILVLVAPFWAFAALAWLAIRLWKDRQLADARKPRP